MPAKRMASAIFGGKRSYFSFLMPSNTRRLSQLAGLTPEDLVLKHTMFPYTIAFMSANEQAKHLHKILNLDSGDIGNAALTQTVSIGVPFRRICPDCIRDDNAQFGETYWHRAHFLPAVQLCNIHGTRLRTTAIPLRGSSHSNAVDLPCSIPSSSPTIQVKDSILESIARISIEAINGKLAPRTDWYATYRSAAFQKGYRHVNGLASSVLAKDVQQFYGASFLLDAGSEIPLNARASWPAVMVRAGTDCPMPTPKHILLQAFLELATNSDGNFQFRKPGKQVKNFSELDAKAAKAITAYLKQHALTNRRFTVTELLEQAKIKEPFRHHRSEFLQTESVIQEFKVSGQAERQIGRRPYWRKRLGLET
jgi:hypothetical protein